MDTAKRGLKDRQPWLGVHLAAAVALALLGVFAVAAGLRYDRELLAASGFVPLGMAAVYLVSLFQEVLARGRRRRFCGGKASRR